MSIQPTLVWLSATLVCLGLNWPRPAVAGGSDMTVEAVLVWGTNSEKPPNKKLKELEPELARKLGKAPYKWKNYFEVNRKTVDIAPSNLKRLPMSEHCELRVYCNARRLFIVFTGRRHARHRQPQYVPACAHIQRLSPVSVMRLRDIARTSHGLDWTLAASA